MKLSEAYSAGVADEWLRQNPDSPIKGKGGLLHALKDYTSLVESCIPRKMLDEILNWIAKLEAYSENSLKADDLVQFKDDMRRWNTLIFQEITRARILHIKLQTGLNPDVLQKMADKIPSEFMSDEIWKKMTNIEKSDYADAAKCLLLGTATPSVMVALRGAEASIRNFYRCKTQNEPENKTWRQLTKELKNQVQTLNIEDTFIGYLDYIGDAKRNFAQHPNKVYTLREAVLIFMQVVGMVADIYAQI